MVSETEVRLPSGAIASNKDFIRRRIRHPKNTTESSGDHSLVLHTTQGGNVDSEQGPSSTATTARNTQALSVRDQRGVIGLSEQQRHSLAIVQKKIRAREQRDRAGHQWTLEKVANKQKHFKVRVEFWNRLC